MTDPISGKVASQMADQVSHAGDKHASTDQADSTQRASFDDVLANAQEHQVAEAEATQQVDGVETIHRAEEAQGPAEARLRDLMDGMRTHQAELESMMERSLSGADMSQQELLHMQSLIYAYSQKVELASKAVSNAASGLKQVMNTQV